MRRICATSCDALRRTTTPLVTATAVTRRTRRSSLVPGAVQRSLRGSWHRRIGRHGQRVSTRVSHLVEGFESARLDSNYWRPFIGLLGGTIKPTQDQQEIVDRVNMWGAHKRQFSRTADRAWQLETLQVQRAGSRQRRTERTSSESDSVRTAPPSPAGTLWWSRLQTPHSRFGVSDGAWPLNGGAAAGWATGDP